MKDSVDPVDSQTQPDALDAARSGASQALVERKAQSETDYARARENVVAFSARFSPAVVEAERLKGRALVEDEEVAALVAARNAAEANYRLCRATWRKESTDAARRRCGRALIEFDRLADKVTSRRAGRRR